LYTITIKHKDVGAKVYDVFSIEEADEKGIDYKHWKEAQQGEYGASDDGYVSQVIKRKTYNNKNKPMDYIRFAWGYTFYNPRYNGKPLKAAGRKSNTTLTGKSYIEAHKNSQIMQDLAMAAAHFAKPDKVIDEVLGKDIEDWERRKWKRTMKSEVFQTLKREALAKRLKKHDLTEDYTLELLQDGIKMAKEKKDVPSIMRAVENLQDMHGMKDKHLVKTTEKLEATSSTKLLDEIIEEEKSIGLERITQSEEE
jgi:hypothetical protein